MNEDEPFPAPIPSLDFISDHLKKALDEMANVTAAIEELKSHDED